MIDSQIDKLKQADLKSYTFLEKWLKELPQVKISNLLTNNSIQQITEITNPFLQYRSQIFQDLNEFNNFERKILKCNLEHEISILSGETIKIANIGYFFTALFVAVYIQIFLYPPKLLFFIILSCLFLIISICFTFWWRINNRKHQIETLQILTDLSANS